MMIASAAATAAAVAAGKARDAVAASPGGMQYRELGSTGEKVSIVGLGGSHIGKVKDEQEAIRIMRTALDSGLNFFDNCWDYNDGRSEQVMGKGLADGYRQKAFLMTKIDGRDAKTATSQLDESLRRLRTDHVDLLQFHEIIRMNDPERVFAQGGALEAVLKAKEQGKLRHIGFTGHKDPLIHTKMLETALDHGFRFDTVQMPLNVMDAHFRSFEQIVLPILVKEGIGVLGMKPMGDPFILKSNTVTPVECLRYTMSLATDVTITGIDSMPILEQALHVGRTFTPLSAAERQDILGRTAQAARDGQFERYKVSQHFDGTNQNPQWLG